MTTPTREDLDRQVDFLDSQSNANLACRQRHDLPRLAPTRNGRLPAGVSAIGPFSDGTYDVLRRCLSCGMTLAHHTTTDGLMIDGKPRRRYPPGYLAKGMGRISPALATGVGYNRISDTLLAGATKPPQEEE